jgi:hypothetical protein
MRQRPPAATHAVSAGGGGGAASVVSQLHAAPPPSVATQVHVVTLVAEMVLFEHPSQPREPPSGVGQAAASLLPGQKLEPVTVREPLLPEPPLALAG